MSVELERAVKSALVRPGTPTPSDVIVAEVTDALSQALADLPDIPKGWLISARIFGLEVPRQLGFEAIDGSIQGRLHDETRRIASRHYQHLVSIGFVKNTPPKMAPPWEPSATLLLALGQLFGLSEIHMLGSLGGGRSGASVVALFARSGAGGEAILVAKLTDDNASFDLEHAGHRSALASWLSSWATQEPQGGQVSDPPHGYFVLLSKLAFPPNAAHLYPESLHSLVSEGQAIRARAVIDCLSRGYRAHIATESCTRTSVLSRIDFLRAIRDRWSGLAGAWSSDRFWAWSGLPAPSVPSFLDGHVVRCNPLWYLCHGVQNDQSGRHPFWMSFQHGDLNCRNLLVENKSTRTPDPIPFRVIDFEKSGEMSSTFDVCWLALWILQSSASGPEPTAEQWEAVPDQFNALMLRRPRQDRHLGGLQLGLDLVETLLSHLWTGIDEAPDQDQRGLLENRLQNQLALTLCACACAMSGYEVRKFNRLIEQGFDEETHDECRHALLRAWLYLRIGAGAVRDLAQPVSAPPTRDVAVVIRRLVALTTPA